METAAHTGFEELGGHAAVKTVVTVFYNRVTADPALAHWFEDVDLSRLRAHQRAFVSMALGGPGMFSGRSLPEAHAGLGITDEAFDTMLAHLETALADIDASRETIGQLLGALEASRAQVVTADSKR
jgi:hemoglobin